jgi:UDP-N-acetylmuramate dehydrogenase
MRDTGEAMERLSGIEFSGARLFGEPMARHTTLRLGGPADLLAIPEDASSLKNLLMEAGELGVPILPLGGGSNLLVTDGGIEGLVVALTELKGFSVTEEADETVLLYAEAGMTLQKIIGLSREHGWCGAEGLAGIPGSLGGAIKGNAGSFGYEIGSAVESLAVLDQSGTISILGAKECGFAYRHSRIDDSLVILSAHLRFLRDDPGEVALRIDRCRQEKRRRQPVGEWSAGCVFKNPEGIAAGKLIDEAGCKGMTRGGIVVSPLHANFFVNRGSATAEDFLWLIDAVQERVLKSIGIGLELEIRIVGRTCCL